MGKYDPLYRHLTACGRERVQMTFAEIEAVLGAKLPNSAYHYRPWWGDHHSHVQSRAWHDAGYRIECVQPGDTVVFRKERT